MLTGTDGGYAFGSLLGGACRVRTLLPAGYLQSTPDPADIDLANGQALTGIDIGMVYSADLTVSLTASPNDNTLLFESWLYRHGGGWRCDRTEPACRVSVRGSEIAQPAL